MPFTGFGYKADVEVRVARGNHRKVANKSSKVPLRGTSIVSSATADIVAQVWVALALVGNRQLDYLSDVFIEIV